VVATVSSRHLLLEQQDEYGFSIAGHLASQASVHLANNDLLGLEALLLSWHERLPIEFARIQNLDAKEVAVAGARRSRVVREYRADILINRDSAGTVFVVLGSDRQLALQQTLMVGLLGLALVLCLLAFIAARTASGALSRRIRAVTARLQVANVVPAEALEAENELRALEQVAAALPLELLQPPLPTGLDLSAYQSIAVVYLQLNSLSAYVDTLDEAALQRYTRRTHQIISAAAGLYGGSVSVVRQFGLALRFSGKHAAGSPALRAASAAWLVHELARELQRHLGRNMSISIAAGRSELGLGSSDDIYPELYLQHALDALQQICATLPPRPLLAPELCSEPDLEARAELLPTELHDYAILAGFGDNQRELLERQLRLVWKQLAVPAGEAPARLRSAAVSARR